MIEQFLVFFRRIAYCNRVSSPNNRIGIFDSGLGGLTVAREIRRAFPWLELICLGDTARFPYGIRSPATLRRYLSEGCLFFEKENVSTVILACNTLSSLLPVLIPGITLHGVIESGAKAAFRATKNKKIGLIGTDATIRSQAYVSALHRLDSQLEVFSRASPLLVPLIEEGWLEGEVPRRVINHYLAPLLQQGIDTLILGCTHYPLLRPIIEQEISNRPGQITIQIVDNGSALTSELRETLKQNPGGGSLAVYVTDAPERFEEIANRFMGERLKVIRKIDLTLQS